MHNVNHNDLLHKIMFQNIEILVSTNLNFEWILKLGYNNIQ